MTYSADRHYYRLSDAAPVAARIRPRVIEAAYATMAALALLWVVSPYIG